MKIDTSYNIRYMIVHGFYQILLILISSYASVFLLDKGFSDGGIGVIMAFSNALSVFVMSGVGDFLDKNPKIPMQVFAIGMLTIMIVFSVALLILQGASWPVGVYMILVMTIMLSFQALVNSICFYLEHQGIRMNFGLARGCGSATFAVASVILGNVMSVVQPRIMPVFYIGASILMGIAFLSLGTGSKKAEGSKKDQAGNSQNSGNNHPKAEESAEKTVNSKEQASNGEAEASLSLGEFVLTYKKYMMFLLGSCLIYMFLLATGGNFTYQILTSIGGGTKELGNALAIAAIVEVPAMVLCAKAVEKFSSKWVLRVSGIFFVVKFILLTLAACYCKSVMMFYIGQVFQFASFGFYFPCAAGYTAEILPRADMVKGQSLFTAMTSVGGFIASLLGGFLLDLYTPAVMVMVMFAIALVGFFIMWFNVGSAE